MAFQFKHKKYAFSDLTQAKKWIFVDIQHRYSSNLSLFRGADFTTTGFHNLASFLAQHEYTEFYVTKKTLTRTDVLRQQRRYITENFTEHAYKLGQYCRCICFQNISEYFTNFIFSQQAMQMGQRSSWVETHSWAWHRPIIQL